MWKKSEDWKSLKVIHEHTLTAHEESTHAGDVLGELNLVNFELMDLVVTTGHNGRFSALNNKLASKPRKMS